MNLIEGANTSGEFEEASSVDDIIRILDHYTESGGSRLRLNVVEGEGGVISRKYHHGRCDIGSPWAEGKAFDVLEDE